MWPDLSAIVCMRVCVCGAARVLGLGTVSHSAVMSPGVFNTRLLELLQGCIEWVTPLRMLQDHARMLQQVCIGSVDETCGCIMVCLFCTVALMASTTARRMAIEGLSSAVVPLSCMTSYRPLVQCSVGSLVGAWMVFTAVSCLSATHYLTHDPTSAQNMC